MERRRALNIGQWLADLGYVNTRPRLYPTTSMPKYWANSLEMISTASGLVQSAIAENYPRRLGKLGKKIDPESRALLAPDAAVRQREAERRS
jgi:hypothetical protein